jgi:dihydrofolate reductase
MGEKRRWEWLKDSFHLSEEDLIDYKEYFQRALNQIHSIPNEIPIYIWTSDNAHEQTGLLFVINLLKEKENNIYIINSSELYKDLFKAKAKKYVPFHLGGFLIEQLKELYNKGMENKQALKNEERHHFEKEWLNLSKKTDVLRLWKKGEMQSVGMSTLN